MIFGWWDVTSWWGAAKQAVAREKPPTLEWQVTWGLSIQEKQSRWWFQLSFFTFNSWKIYSLSGSAEVWRCQGDHGGQRGQEGWNSPWKPSLVQVEIKIWSRGMAETGEFGSFIEIWWTLLCSGFPSVGDYQCGCTDAQVPDWLSAINNGNNDPWCH